MYYLINYICTIQQDKDNTIMKTTIQNNLIQYLNTCTIKQDESYNGHSLVDTHGEVIASHDGNWDKTEIEDEVLTNDETTIVLDQVGRMHVTDYLMNNN